MIIGIDASNIRAGGGVTHLKELVENFSRKQFPEIEKLIVFAGNFTLKQINPTKDVELIEIKMLNNSIVYRVVWQLFFSTKCFKLYNIQVLLSLSGTYIGGFKPFVAMSQNMLLYDKIEYRRYHFSLKRFRLIYLRIVQSISFRKASALIFISKYAKQTIYNDILKLNAPAIVINHGISPRFNSEPKIQNDIKLYKEEPYKLLYISSIDAYKHQWILIEAIYYLRNKGFNIALELLGAPLHRKSVEKLNIALKQFDPNGNFVKYHGEKNYKEIDLFYKNADLFIYSSTCENMPNILIEAMASGLPIVSSNFGPMTEFLKDKAIYFNPTSVSETIDAIERVIINIELRSSLVNGSIKLSKNYSWDKCSSETFKFLLTLRKTQYYTSESIAFRIKKFFRFIKIYGLNRTINKAFGRLRSDFIPALVFSKSKNDISIIGCGQFAFSSISFFLRKHKRNFLLNTYDVNNFNSSTLINFYNGVSAVTDINDLISNGKCKFVYIASNHSTHTDYAIQALRQKKIVYIEKPISTTYDDLAQLELTRITTDGIIYAGYNRPYSKAFKIIKNVLLDKCSRENAFTINYYIVGHKIEKDHWYRLPEEGTRVCGNIGHWLDATIHILNWRSIPDFFEISISYSNVDEPDDNVSICLVSSNNDLINIVLTSRSEPFEGINESINIQFADINVKLDDFRKMQVWKDTSYKKYIFKPKDVGHERSILQPFYKNNENRDWNEVVLSSLLMIKIKDMILNLDKHTVFDFKSSINDFNKKASI